MKIFRPLLAVAALVFTGAAASAPTAAVTAVEFYNAALDHYFVSPLGPDLDALDSGRIAGWVRTGQSIRVFPSQLAGGPGASPVCRFYIPPQHGDSHFFSASPVECAAVAQAIGIDPNYSGYILETPNAFYVALPDPVSGSCPAGTAPVYRLWNQRADSNHRYTTDPAIKAQMIARGYLAEGNGPNAVAICAVGSTDNAVVGVSRPSPFAPGCDGVPATAVLYTNAEVEPRVAVDPLDGNHLIGVWQQDRWSDGGARGLLTGISRDAGRTWVTRSAAFSRCTGGSSANGADYPRTTDPWIAIAPDGTAHQIAVSFSGPTFGASSANAVLVSRSTDGGLTWGAPTTLIRDTRTAFNDKESITADPADARLVYAVWDRVVQAAGGPTWFSRTTDGGVTWEPARAIFDPGGNSQTLNNQIVVLPDGMLVNFFTQLVSDGGGHVAATLVAIRSADQGINWSAPITIESSSAVGVADPESGAPVRDAANIGSVAVGRNGALALTWQDSRFSGGARDAIAFARSLDGGLTWSPAVRINAVPGVPAFIPTVQIRDDGTYGVSYYDVRNNTTDSATLPTDYWLTQSTDGVTWQETHVSGPFDLALAPNAMGFFLGDYQSLTSIGTRFIPFFAQTNADFANRTDIFVAFPGGSATMDDARRTAGTIVTKAGPAPIPILTPALQERLDQAAKRTLARRWKGPLPANAATAVGNSDRTR
ncbi:MAG: sialidase family protein [Betaproteobacteria bacterium]